MAEVKIYFGSQSGTAESFSDELCEDAQSQGLSCEVLDLQAFTPENFALQPIVILVVATYGDGEPSDNAIKFHKWVTDPRNDGALKGQMFTVMGLGDMNYSKFNNMGLSTDQSLERMGGTRIYRRGVGDDSQDIAADFQDWKTGGLFKALQAAAAEARKAGGGGAGSLQRTQQAEVCAVATAPVTDFNIFFAQEEADGAAKDLCEALCAEMRGLDLSVAGVHSMSERKTVEVVKKLPRRSIAVVLADVGPEGLCSAGRKLIRNMSLEIDAGALADKQLKYAFLAVASSRCNNSANAMKEANRQAAQGLPKAFDRAGILDVPEKGPGYVDAGVDAVENVVKELASALKRSVPAAVAATVSNVTAEEKSETPAAIGKKTKIFCAGVEAKEAGEALAAAWPGGSATVEDASLQSIMGCVKERVQAILLVECTADGSLSDVARNLAAQLTAAPLALKAQLRQLHFGLVAMAASHYGNAGERASTRGALTEITRAVAPVEEALTKSGAKCVGSVSLDLQESNEEKLAALCGDLQKGFAAISEKAAPLATPQTAAPVMPAAAPTAPKAAMLKMAPTAAGLPAEAKGEPADVLARFYFEADKAKITRVRELRQKPCVEEGLSTMEVELEAAGSLKEYTLGGTLSLLPESDQADVEAAVVLMGLSKADLGKCITFVAIDGSNSPIKRPFPTPCTLGDALYKYCDLARAPSKKMLTALQSKLSTEVAKEHVAKLLGSAEALKSLQSAKHCCRMHEFWAMMGVTAISPNDFLVNCPRQKAREFTIASSPKASPGKITLCVSLTSHEQVDLSELVDNLRNAGCVPAGVAMPSSRGRFFGTCSSWLTARLKAGDMVLAKSRPSVLRLPAKDVPVIMVGAGAGVAPFRGFWDDLRRGSQTAPATLFFGCRNPEQDWLFRDEMSSAVKLTASCGALARMQVGPKRPLAALYTAFSRPGEGKEGKYVQDLMRAQSKSVKHWVEKMKGCIYVCGSTGMGNGVLDVLAEILDGGSETVDSLRKEDRIVVEMWG